MDPNAPVELPDDPTQWNPRFEGDWHDWEIFWVRYQSVLASKGYKLRPRYHRDWVPSWFSNGRGYEECGDSVTRIITMPLLDATRISDELPVVLKRIDSGELENIQFLAGRSNFWDPRNHCLPPLEMIILPDDPTILLCVFPYVVSWHLMPFDYRWQVMDFVHQLLEGLEYIHARDFAHRGNIMMDAAHLILEPFHPAFPWRSLEEPRQVRIVSRRQVGIKYYYIDFGNSVAFPSYESRIPMRSPRAQDDTAPEYTSIEPHDVFKLDIYLVGNMLRTEVLDKYPGLEFLEPIVNEMIQIDPSARPSARDAFTKLLNLQTELTIDFLEDPIRSVSERLADEFLVGDLAKCGPDPPLSIVERALMAIGNSQG